ncbi:reverse transcriptase domain-containing protein [Tanacetum coccineum]
MRQKEKAQEEETKPRYRVKRDTSLADYERILQAKAGKRQANPPKKLKKETYTHGWGQAHHDRGMRIKEGVPAGQQKPQAKEGKTLENSFEATPRVLANVSKKSRKSGTPPTAKAAGRIPGPKNCMTPKTTTTGADTGSPKSIGPKKDPMPVNVKTYDGTGDPDDHLKIFQAAKKIERWAMPTWCHMFNSTLIGSARVWFDKLPSESIDDYEMLRKTFLEKYSQQKKYIKAPVEIHHIKHREGESTEAFMERFKAESMHVSEAPKCMKISRFMHGITNPDIIKRLNDNIPNSVDEMMSVTTAFLRGEVAAANQSKKKAPPAWKHHETSHRPNFDKRLNFENQHKSSRRQDRFTPLTKTPKEILAMDTMKFKAPPPMTGPAEIRNKKKICEFHGDKGHITGECIHPRRQIEEAVKSGQLSHLVKEIKQGGKLGEHAKAAKKGKLLKKEKLRQFSWSSPGNG